MSKLKIILILSIFVTIMPYLGFPSYLKDILYSVIGLGIATLAYIFYTKIKKGESREKTFDNFSENSNFTEERDRIRLEEDESLN